MKCRVPRRLLAAVVVVAAFGASCSVSETLTRPMCQGDTSGLIVAQSVPSATLLPCFEALPTGWEFSEVDVTQAGTIVVLDSDRAGDGAARFDFTADCETAGVATPSEYDRAQRFEHVHSVVPRFRADRYYRFDGGCLRWQFDFDVDAPSALSVELGNVVQLIERTVINDNVRATFIDEEL